MRIIFGVLRVRGARGVVSGGRGVRVPVLHVDGTGAGKAAGVKVGVEGVFRRRNRGSLVIFLLAIVAARWDP